ncbi:SANT/Myb domain [Macleaya cordata]|uniref:SANT/Myb domain n=1 Tax=Macleaya cordata TaxID=56857 RepID=A0A200Q3K5_MACCD|nr:SANT/Myb domain [Macleaya cordata]
MKMKAKDYMEALEEERRKIQVFQRELPLCLELVNQAIENCTKKMYYEEQRSDCEEQTLSDHGPVLEQFLPLKRSNSSFQEEEEEVQQSKRIGENLGKKVDWLKSVQLWNQNPDPVPTKEDDDLNGKCSKIELKKCGGAFQPFQSEKGMITSTSRTTTTTTTTTGTATATATATATSIEISAPSSVQTTATSSTTGDTDHGSGNNRKNKEETKEGDLRRKTRRCWSQELHKRFLEALQQLGGSHVATPKQIKELMKVDGLTNDEVKSHLQKYRIHTRGPSPTTTHNDGNPQPPQFVVVGGIWVPPPEYVTMGEANKEGARRMTTNGIYVPLAAPPQQGVSSCSQQQQQQQQKQQQHQSPTGSLHSEGRSNRGEHSINVHSNSPTTSSSTETDDNVISKLTCN